MGKKLAESRSFNIPDDDESASLWIAGRNQLQKKGYFQYEVSNFALKGFESRHNMTYWNLDTYIGVGPGATGTIITGNTAYRTTNTHDISRWLERPEASFEVEHITQTDCIREVILMGMRISSGLSRKKFIDRFGIEVAELIGNTLIKWSEKKLLTITPASIAMNEGRTPHSKPLSRRVFRRIELIKKTVQFPVYGIHFVFQSFFQRIRSLVDEGFKTCDRLIERRMKTARTLKPVLSIPVGEKAYKAEFLALFFRDCYPEKPMQIVNKLVRVFF